MVRFSTTLCPSEEPPPAKRLKTSSLQHQEQQAQEQHDGLLRQCRTLSASSSSSSSSIITPLPSNSCVNDPFASFDLDILDCNVCMEALSPPIFQCCNGHYACGDCTRKMSSKCPSCTESIGKIRNLGLEKILESLRVRCKFYNQGCPVSMLPYTAKKNHEQRCLFAPRDCPLSDCSHNGPLDGFSSHFNHKHNVRTLPFCFDMWFTVALSLTDKYTLLKGGNTYFLLQAHEEHYGKLLYVSYVVPPDFEEINAYQVEVKMGKRHLTLASTVQSLPHSKPNLNFIDFLLVPRCFLGDGGYQVEVSIKPSIQGAIEKSLQSL